MRPEPLVRLVATDVTVDARLRSAKLVRAGHRMARGGRDEVALRDKICRGGLRLRIMFMPERGGGGQAALKNPARLN